MNIESTHLLDLAKSSDPEQFPFIALSQNHLHGWVPVFAYDPVDIYHYNEGLDGINEFFQKNSSRMIAGYIGYDQGMKQLGINSSNPSLLDLPDTWFAAYDNFALIENEKIKWQGKAIDRIKKIDTKSVQTLNFNPLTARKKYNDSLKQIVTHIINGDIYQANLTHFLEAKWFGNKWHLFSKLFEKNPVDFAACFLNPDFSIYSLSPEKFISSNGKTLITEPIKGTRPRGINELEDAIQRDKLLSSEKEAAELNMITDLLRNDLGKICKSGSVELVRHRETMALTSVWHTYSTIRGELFENTSLIDGIISMLPGGSITGCPKRRAIEIIDGLEEYRRNLYTGTIGYQLPNGQSFWNISIRTILQEEDRLLLGVGGGITLDSNAEDEYNETLAKAKSFMEIQA